MTPSLGRIVHYRLTEQDVQLIEAGRRTGTPARTLDDPDEGIMLVQFGNPVREGDVYPLVVVRAVGNEQENNACINGKVLLDGTDTLWVTSRTQGDGTGNWFWPPRV